MLEDFFDNIFGEYANRTSREQFIQNLAYHGWKYFDLKNLNELFSIMYEKYGAVEDLDLP